ncbi:hypothetical protein [Lacrimispora sp.]|uniref:hypothetical protein n=1 Tax=Lacrimispora sp. TaxID=2719234 RepID=UPI0028AA4EA6|nr:hypothetical protein [Lacrimispora sp.]
MQGIKIYDVFDNGEWIGSYTADAITKLYKVPRAMIMAYASSGTRAQRRYTFASVMSIEKGSGLDKWKAEWDRARLKLLETGGNGN